MSNRADGTSFEQEFCNMLFEHGFWATCLKQSNSGQPADVLAARNGKAYLIDCKVCSHGYFSLSRVEENQVLAMTLWKECGNGEGWFALKVNDEVFMLPYFTVKAYQAAQSYMTIPEICEVAKPLERWVAKCK